MSTLLVTLLLLLTPPSFAKKGAEPPPNWYATEANKEALSAANSLLAQKKFSEAATAFDALLVLEPSCGVILVGAGRAHLGEGKPADAVVPLQKATSLFADRVDAWIPYGQALLGAQKYPEAVTAAKSTIALKPTSVDAIWVAEQALMAQKDHAGAHALLVEARARGWMPVLDCMDGLVYVAEGAREKAVEMQGRCRDFHPWSDQLADAVATLPGGAPAAPAPPATATAPPTP